MAQNWIHRSENTLKRLKRLMEKPNQDRLDLVRIERFALGALGQSLAGWMQWINSPVIMSNFSQGELEDMVKTFVEMVEAFIEFDIKITKEGILKGLVKRREAGQRSRFVI